MVWRKLSLAEVVEKIPIGVAVTRPDGRIEYANPHLHALLKEPGEGLLGRCLAAFRQGDEPRLAPLDGGEWRGESRLRIAAGGVVHVLEVVHPVHDESGAIACRIHFLRDLSAQKRVELLSSLAFYDSLTGLPNRNLFKDRLARAILSAERRADGFALFYIDIDRFKTVNDAWGHETGDRLLREAAARMSRVLRRSDTLARLGGDEFVAILEDVKTHARASAAAEKLFALCGERYELNDSFLRVTLSVGISLYPQDGRDAAALLEHADRAMYQAKAQGRNCYSLVAAPYGLSPDGG
jgi:diguanylate cyclase (GGDEF)-like protein